jgi:hypothetical protein
MLTERGHKISVLAVDPSSCASGGEYAWFLLTCRACGGSIQFSGSLQLGDPSVLTEGVIPVVQSKVETTRGAGII